MATPADIATIARFLTNTDSTSFTDAQILLFVNQSYERINGKILSETAGGRWKWGDLSYTAFPTYTKNLVSGQKPYEIDFSATDNTANPLIILGVEVVDQNANSHPLTPITIDEILDKGISVTDYQSTNGIPIEYEKREHLVVLHPAPDNGVSVTLTNGLRIFFLRGANILANVTATNRQIGFPIPWQDVLAWEAAYIYAIVNLPSKAAFLLNGMQRKEKELMSFIARRNQDDRPIMSMKPIIYY